MRAKVRTVAWEILNAAKRVEAGKRTLLETRRVVVSGWNSVIRLLNDSGQRKLAEDAANFLKAMVPARTEREAIASELLMAKGLGRVHERSSDLQIGQR